MAKKKKSFMTPKASRRKARKRLATTTSRAKKEFTYRGYSVADLKMPLWPSEESESMSVIELLPARARRTIAPRPLRGERASPRPHPPDVRPHRAHAPP